MDRTRTPVPAAAKAAGLAALILGLTFGGGSPAAAHLAGQPVATLASDNEETSCDQAAEAAVAAAEQNLEVAFKTDRRALERLREQFAEHNTAARDLLNKAGADLKRIFATAESALDNDEDATCAASDPAALDATASTAIAAMDQVVADVSVAVAALPADQAKAKDDDDDDD